MKSHAIFSPFFCKLLAAGIQKKQLYYQIGSTQNGNNRGFLYAYSVLYSRGGFRSIIPNAPTICARTFGLMCIRVSFPVVPSAPSESPGYSIRRFDTHHNRELPCSERPYTSSILSFVNPNQPFRSRCFLYVSIRIPIGERSREKKGADALACCGKVKGVWKNVFPPAAAISDLFPSGIVLFSAIGTRSFRREIRLCVRASSASLAWARRDLFSRLAIAAARGVCISLTVHIIITGRALCTP